MGELAGFSVAQEAAISVCEARKDAAVAIIEAFGDAVQKLAQPQRKRFLGIF